MDPYSIDLAWFKGEDIVTIDGRVTIVESTNNSTNITFNSNSSVITTVIQFDPLFEDDEGTYSCYSIVNESVKFRSVQLQNFRSKLYVIYGIKIFCTQNTWLKLLISYITVTIQNRALLFIHYFSIIFKI